ncbi:lactate utilization protein [Dysosmobacter sp.]|uniref:lactate utilization protein n=1 Tax=Dysosmobacter sp. TaxID=2591382 RepID=UPI002A88D4DF|nr:lactate utilization protein [Dysosmobacter sp.]MDY3985689.1 lactate utilization protein [Dysosmobacter sp.]
MAFDTVKKNLEARGFSVKIFSTGAEAAAYLDGAIDGTSVGFGGSLTAKELGLYDKLAAHNEVHWHWEGGPGERVAAAHAKVYITSANGLAETGEIINIDGAGNRVAATLFGHGKVYFVIGRNKLAPTYEEALWRARNIAAPKNAQRLGKKTPCAVKGDKCYDCKSPDRICRGLVVLWGPSIGVETEIVLVDQDLGL